jgi:choline dehydrogenase-like flavoprotein
MCTRNPSSWAETHYQAAPGTWLFGMWAVGLAPRSIGSLRLLSRDPDQPPRIDSAFLTDPEDRDLETLVDGVELMRTLASQPALRHLLGAELAPGPSCRDRDGIRDYVRAHALHDYPRSAPARWAPPPTRPP